jgi:quercetin dioxygenase-like cupin family protein
MNVRAIRSAVLAACVCAVAAQAQAPGVVAITPSEMKWAPQGGQGVPPGLEQTFLIGDPTKAGSYTVRLKFPAGFKVAPLTHPDAREVTILSGTYRTGYGDTFDPAGLKTLPAGSFYTEPANVPHYIEVQEDVVVQVSGIGPSGRKFVGPGDGKK